MLNSDKRDLIRRAITEHPEVSNRQLAKDLGTSDKTVATVRAECGIPNPLRTAAAEPVELVVEQSGRLVALVDLVIEVAPVREVTVAAGFEIRPELRDRPRRAA